MYLYFFKNPKNNCEDVHRMLHLIDLDSRYLVQYCLTGPKYLIWCINIFCGPTYSTRCSYITNDPTYHIWNSWYGPTYLIWCGDTTIWLLTHILGVILTTECLVRLIWAVTVVVTERWAVNARLFNALPLARSAGANCRSRRGSSARREST